MLANPQSTLSSIRLARPSDEPELLRLVQLMHAENGWQALDVDSVRETLALAFNRKGGILAVIGVPGAIRAMIFVRITRWWFTKDNHLEELFNFVHPEHRNSDYAKILIEYAKVCSDELSDSMGRKVPLMMGVLASKRMSAKVRLYRRFFGMPVGAFFLHNAAWVKKDDITEEDFWRVPALSRLLFQRAKTKDQKSRA